MMGSVSRRGMLAGSGCCFLAARAQAGDTPAPPPGSAYAYLGGRVDESVPVRLLAMLQKAVSGGLGRLTLVLNSRGGDVSSGLAAYEILTAADIELTTYNIGAVESIGVFVFLAGTRRVANPRSSFLMHGITSGERTDRDRQDDELREVSYRKELAILRARTSITEPAFLEMMRGYRIFGPEDALAAGLATEVAALRFPFGERLFE